MRLSQSFTNSSGRTMSTWMSSSTVKSTSMPARKCWEKSSQTCRKRSTSGRDDLFGSCHLRHSISLLRADREHVRETAPVHVPVGRGSRSGEPPHWSEQGKKPSAQPGPPRARVQLPSLDQRGAALKTSWLICNAAIPGDLE